MPEQPVLHDRIQARLDQISTRGLLRALQERPLYESFQGNDYLGLSRHPEVLNAYKTALDGQGCGSGGSPLITGYSASHRELEMELAQWLGTESAVLFTSGFAANCGLMEVLDSLDANFYVDRLCHASVYSHLKGLSRQKRQQRVQRFNHNDSQQLAALLEQARNQSSSNSALNVVCTEGIFSMDGDTAPLEPLAELCSARPAQDTVLHIDDAHALGCTGSLGRGSTDILEQFRNRPENTLLPIIITGTFGKAFGQSGAFIGCTKPLADLIVNQCRHYIYSTAFSPAQAEALRVALRIITGAEGDELRAKLRLNINTFRTYAVEKGLPLMESESAIQPVLLGTNERAIRISKTLRQRGLSVNPIRPPTVPEGSARIRFTLSAVHSPDQIKQLVEFVAQGMTQS